MFKSVVTKALFVLIIFAGQSSRAASLLQSLPNFNSEPLMSSGESIALGRGCLMLPSSDLSLPCNAAFLADSDVRQFQVHVFGDQGIQHVGKLYDLVRREDHVGFVEEIINDGRPTLGRAWANLWYQGEFWAVNVTPLKTDNAIKKINSAYPEVAAHVREQFEAAIGTGLHFAEDPRLRVGAWARYQNSKYYRGEFAVLDAVADPEMLEFDQSHAVLLEPSVIYELEPEWHTQFVAVLTGATLYYSGERAGRPETRGDLGLNFQPPVTDLKMTFGVQMGVLGDEIWARRIRLSSLVETDWFNFAMGLGLGEIGLHVSTAIDSLVVGVGFQMVDFESEEQWGQRAAHNVTFDLGLRF